MLVASMVLPAPLLEGHACCDGLTLSGPLGLGLSYLSVWCTAGVEGRNQPHINTELLSFFFQFHKRQIFVPGNFHTFSGTMEFNVLKFRFISIVFKYKYGRKLFHLEMEHDYCVQVILGTYEYVVSGPLN
jgi:hypothetical protein